MATTRVDERLLASMGKLAGAPLRFEAATDVSGGGVLCAVPVLLANIVSRLLALGPVTARLLAELAADTVKLGDEAQAIQLLDQALAKDPQCAPALIVASTIYGNRNDLRRALDYSKRAVIADPRDARGYANLAVALFKSGQPNQAPQARTMNLSPYSAEGQACRNV